MFQRKRALARRGAMDPFALMREMAADFDRMFADWPSFRLLAQRPDEEEALWLPKIDVFERDGRLVTRVDLPGMTRDDVSVEVTDGQLVLSGERKQDKEEKKANYYRAEREYGSFYRSVPLPEGVNLEDVKATFTDGVLEVSVPLPAQAEPKVKKVEIEEAKPVKTAA